MTRGPSKARASTGSWPIISMSPSRWTTATAVWPVTIPARSPLHQKSHARTRPKPRPRRGAKPGMRNHRRGSAPATASVNSKHGGPCNAGLAAGTTCPKPLPQSPDSSPTAPWPTEIQKPEHQTITPPYQLCTMSLRARRSKSSPPYRLPPQVEHIFQDLAAALDHTYQRVEQESVHAPVDLDELVFAIEAQG